MSSSGEISTSFVVSESQYDLSSKIKCHSSKQLFCRGDICFIEYAEIAPTKTEYGCITLEKDIEHNCNETIDFIHRECCSTIFCNSRLFNHDVHHRYHNRLSTLNISAINDNGLLFHSRLQIAFNMIMGILLFSLLCAIVIYLLKKRIQGVRTRIGQRTRRSTKLQPSLSPAIPINGSKILSFINEDKSSNNIIYTSPGFPTTLFSVDECFNDPPVTLIKENKSSDII